MFDVFYIGNKPNLFVHECAVESIEQAQQQSRTGYFWMVSYLVDYTGFDFLWKPAPWQSHQRHAWASQHQIDSGTYLVPKTWDKRDTNYHSEVIQRKSGIAVVEIDHLDGRNPRVHGFVGRWPSPYDPIGQRCSRCCRVGFRSGSYWR